MIRELREEDLDSVSDIHLREFKNSFFCLLGKNFLLELYGGILKSEYALSYVFEKDGRVVGFASGTIWPDKFFKTLLISRFLRFSVIIAKRALTNPKILFYGLQTLSYSGKTSADAEVLAIAVDGSHRKKGVGSELMENLLSAFRKKSAHEIKVIVDEENTPANKFYLKHDFKLAKNFVLYGKKMNVYVRRLDA